MRTMAGKLKELKIRDGSSNAYNKRSCVKLSKMFRRTWKLCELLGGISIEACIFIHIKEEMKNMNYQWLIKKSLAQ